MPTLKQRSSVTASDSEPFAALGFKIMTDPFVGQLCFFRVYSGVLNSGSYVYNSTKGKRERVGRLLKMHANKREEIKEVYAGDIAAAVGLKYTTTGDTLCFEDARGYPRVHRISRAGHLHRHRAENEGRSGKAWHRASRNSPARTPPSGSGRTKRPARPSSPVWASFISRSSSTA